MTARGRQASWIVIIAALLFSVGALPEPGAASLTRLSIARIPLLALTNSRLSGVQTLPPPPTPAAPRPVASKRAPRVRWEQPDFDFGALYQNEQITHVFRFRNIGRSPLRLGKVSTSCGCTAAAPSATVIPSGGAGSIKVTFRSERTRGPVVKYVYVDSNDPAAARSVLTLRGTVKVEVDVVPFGIYFGSLKLGQMLARPVFIRPVDVKRFRILGVKSTSPLVTVGPPEPAPAPEPPGTYRILVRVGPSDKVALINSHLLIRTDLPHTKVIDLQVYGRVVDLGKPRATPASR